MPNDPAAEARRLTTLLSHLDQFANGFDAAFLTWRQEVVVVLARAYGKNSEEVARFESISFESRSVLAGSYVFQTGSKQADLFLRSRIDELTPTAGVESVRIRAKRKSKATNGKVFIVHGHDHGMKETVARFLAKLNLESVILHEQSDQGRTIIEKFEQHADVAFAIALFSTDDVGASNLEISDSLSKPIESSLKPRPRQNVVFECGYFIGKLGRKKVAVLHADGVEMMSDYTGVAYIPFDAGDAWRTRLFKELKASGFHLDANKMFQS